MVGVKGLKPSTSRSQTERAINCATPRCVYLGDYSVFLSVFPVVFCRAFGYDKDMIRALLDKLFRRQLPWYERHFAWLVVLGVGIAMALSLTIGLLQSVWFDEAYSILLAKQPVAELLRLTSLDTHPPLYYLLLKGWAGIFGWSELALRSLSVLAMGGALAAGVLFVKKYFGVKAGLTALVLAAITPFLLRYGFEIRMYALASLIGVSATWALVCAVNEQNKKKQRWLFVLYAVLVALGIYTLYYLAILWIVHVVWLVWLARGRKESVVKQRWWLAYAGSVLLFLPWLPTFVSQLTNGALAPIAQQMTVENLVGVVSFLSLYQASWQLNGLLSLVAILVIGLIIYITVKAFNQVDKKQRPYLVLLALYAFLPIVLIALISLVRPMYVERYLAHTLLGFVLFIAVATWLTIQKVKHTRMLIPGIFVAVFLLGAGQLANVGNYNFQRLQIPQVNQAAKTISCKDNEVVLAADPYVAIELAYYLPKCTIHFYSEYATMGGGYAPLSDSSLRVADPEKELADETEITYVYYDEPKLTMPARLNEVKVSSFGPLHVAEY